MHLHRTPEDQALAVLREQPCVELSAETVAARINEPFVEVCCTLSEMCITGRVRSRYVPGISRHMYWAS